MVLATRQIERATRSERITETASGRKLPGRRFQPVAERALDPVLRDLASRLPGAGRGVTVLTEMPGPTGMPDLVAIPATPRLAIRLALACPPVLAWGDARLAAACSIVRPVTTATLSTRLEADPHAVARRARRLARVGALIAADRGWLRAPGFEPVGRVYSLEAKVDDWAAGMSQALRYAAWSDACGLVMAQLPRDTAPAVKQARQLGIGLALGSRWLVRPAVHRLALAQRLWASEHVVAALR